MSRTSTNSSGECVFRIGNWMNSPNHFNTPSHDATIISMFLMLEHTVFGLSTLMHVRHTINLKYGLKIKKIYNYFHLIIINTVSMLCLLDQPTRLPSTQRGWAILNMNRKNYLSLALNHYIILMGSTYVSHTHFGSL